MKSSRRRSSVFTFIDGKKVDTNNKGMKEGGCDDLKQHHVVCVPVEESSYDDEKCKYILLSVAWDLRAFNVTWEHFIIFRCSNFIVGE